MLITFAEHFNYVVVIILMMTGLYVVFASNNMIKKMVGLSTFQTSVFLLYITIGKVTGGVPPILVKSYGDKDGGHGADYADKAASYAGDAAAKADIIYSNPLPHVLILTAIVVGVATLAVGLALIVRIREVYGTIEEEEIEAINYRFNLEGADDIAPGKSLTGGEANS